MDTSQENVKMQRTTLAIFDMMLYYSLLLYGCFLNFILYPTIGPKLFAHFVSVHVSMDRKIIVEIQTTNNPLIEVV
jgi:hypothetical protein